VGWLALLAGVVVLGFPYLSIREVSLASNVRFSDPAAALSDLAQAARLNPWSSVPGRLGGAIALQSGRFAVAEQRFRQSTDREPGGWFAWLGAGLAGSALGQTPTAVHDFKAAYAINTQQPAITAALDRARSRRPLTYNEMLQLLVIAR
jgi:Flp pilus assembly protein TadD